MKLELKEINMYNVWVGRRENEHLLSRDKAYAIAQKYIDKGYSVSIEERYTDGSVYVDVMVELPKEGK
tara:strand:- start:178 stop:381 length:204 start_codon:yes stop_codon:yes gene_type:complete